MRDFEIKVGCCGFCKSMKSYFSEFEVVEVQKTFYKPPKIETAEKWRKEADKLNESFEFTVKAWQVITHPSTSPTYKKAKIDENMLKNCGFFNNSESVFKAWKATKEISEKLRAKIIIFQTPKSFKTNIKNIENMLNFFSSIDKSKFIFVWEPRGWDTESIKEVCNKISQFCAFIHCTDPFISNPVYSGEISYFRLHGHEKNRINYRHKYTEEELKWILEYVKKLKYKTYLMFNNINMCNDAKRFKELIR